MAAVDREGMRGATVRAVSGLPSAELVGDSVRCGGVRVSIAAPHVRLSDDADPISPRGAIDGIALHLQHSDADLHRRLRPSDPVAAWLFEILEQLRVESLADRSMPGIASNLRDRHVRWSLAVHDAGVTASSSGLLLYATVQVCRARLTGDRVVEQTEDLLEAPRAALSPHIGTAVAGLRGARTDQEEYAGIAATIGERVSAMLDEDIVGTPDDGEPTALTLYLDGDDGSASQRVSVHPRASVDGPTPAPYGVFTTAYDRTHDVVDLVRPAQLDRYRRRLDVQVVESGLNVRRLARDLHRLFREPREHGWSGGHEEGYVDGRRLSRLVTSQDRRDLFVRPGVDAEPQCRVGVLVDCSGSMKSHLDQVSLFVDVLGHALELADVRTDILGFTTSSWNGGRALRDWQRAGGPASPGRLNERCHLVLKAADVPWRKGRRGLAALLKPDVFREGVDGEAVDWASARMPADVGRRVLIVVSDGSPMDTATARANGPEYLDDHLRATIAEQERGGVEVIGVGIGTGLLSRYYSRSIRLDTNTGIGMHSYRDLLALIGTRRVR
ncbi:cobaltochelatase CobT-related protein [Solicola gregarius]|uniref:Cobalamin biosynthesis protein CobT VWA domain-containing protein n=1 Tax=Solicola gregarius TaxID=2908642 RepID=A0AA46TDN4_9ACTN|nr:hypothetical protein [Solicola gregarius]UYM03331.1 hypothetical protein L0C25_12265 [Solicola gregarius]